MKRLKLKKYVLVIIIICEWLITGCGSSSDSPFTRTDLTDVHVLEQAFKTRQNNLQVTQEGEIIRLLSDDTEGSQHQRCIVKLSSGQTLLIAHNIDLAPRVPEMRTGELLLFHGEYEWNEKGGVIHWTHHDPGGYHEDGWLEYHGTRYQ